MADQRRVEAPVLIVGAGPAGLTAAIALARHGIDSLLVERRPELSTLPRATVVSTRTMELLGPGLTLFTGPESTPWEAAASAGRWRVPVSVSSLEAITARALGIRGGGALVARPDGVPTGWFAPGSDAARALEAAMDDPVPAPNLRARRRPE